MSNVLPEPDPKRWRYIDQWGTGSRYQHRIKPMFAIFTVEEHRDGMWLHLSISHRDRIPSYYELKDAKSDFMGDRRAFQIFPPQEEFVNMHENCLHLWAGLEHDPLPDLDGSRRSMI